MCDTLLSMKFFDLGLHTLPLQFFPGRNSILHRLAQTPSRRIIRVLRAEFRLRHASCFVRRQPVGHSLGGGALAVEAEHEDHENFLEDISLWIRNVDPVCLSKLCDAMSLVCSLWFQACARVLADRTGCEQPHRQPEALRTCGVCIRTYGTRLQRCFLP